MERILLGMGRLNWHRDERITDRYGTIHLNQIDLEHGEKPITFNEADGYGTLIAIVTEARKSHHLGDFARGVVPTTPNVGEEIVLGNGELFCSEGCHDNRLTEIGVKPNDGREVDWMDIHALYRCHNQTVELWFEPDEISEKP